MKSEKKKVKDNDSRIKRPLTIGGIVGGLMLKINRPASAPDLARRWGAVAGDEIAALCELKSMRGKGEISLTVRAKNPAAALRLSYLADEIAARVNKYLGEQRVKSVKIAK
ncbi:MAG: DUF721 domain-containing protein [Rickettsiales bacterium]|jgi:hypothetical protein|nr:DUF721 domain-containing protein [Rickettsiales bacterium]